MTTPTNYGDVRAKYASLWERAHDATPDDEWPMVTLLTDGPALAKVPPDHSAWTVGPWDDATPRHIIIVPALDSGAPFSLHRRLVARVIALATGRCPLCSGVAGLNQQPPAPGEARAPWHVFPLYVAMNHTSGCPADDWTDRERLWFPAFRPNERTTL